MRILMIATHLSSLDNLLNFGKQLVKRAAPPPTVVLALDKATHQTPPSPEIFQAQVRSADGYAHAETQIRTGRVDWKIWRDLLEGVYDLVIVGDHPPRKRFASPWRKLLITQRITRIPCPVLILRGAPREIHRILLCDSGGGSSLLSRFTAQLAGLLDGEEEITVLHVMSQISAGPGVVGKQLRAEANELMAEHTPEGELLLQDLTALAKPGVHSLPKIRHGLVLDEILSEARTADYDLVVIGAHRGEGWRRFLLDDLAQKIIQHMDRPVLVVQ